MLIFKLYDYNSRGRRFLNLDDLLNMDNLLKKILKLKKTEKKIASVSNERKTKFNKKSQTSFFCFYWEIS